MSESITVLKNYQYRLYRNDKKDAALRRKIFVASTIWNHFIALQRRYHKLTKGYISLKDMNNHVLKLRRSKRFALWKGLQSQACQNICKRIDDAYQRFFNRLAKGRPKFRKAKKYKSFTFPQSGYKLTRYNQNILKPQKTPLGEDQYTRERATLEVAGECYHFVQHRPMLGKIKTLTVKRDAVGRLWLFFCVEETRVIKQSSTGESGGFDFGLKTFLTDHTGHSYLSPQIFAHGLTKTRRLSRQVSRKVAGSKRRKRARRALARHSAYMADKRRDHHFKLAHELCNRYDVLYFEDLNLRGMKALWGRKVSDLGFGKFLNILEWVALKRGKSVVTIPRFTPTTQICSACGTKNTLGLRDRVLHCGCGLVIHRDHNAALNILCVGASTPYRSGG